MCKFLLAFFCWAFAVTTSAQIVIRGKVTDNNTNLPIVKASVYLNNTSEGTVTNNNGEFVLNVKNIYTGELIVSSVGYQPLSYKLNIADAGKVSYTFKLSIKESVLQGVMVMDDAARKKWMAVFKENFLGITEEADRCTIKNPEALYFAAGENKNSIYAYADTPLVIVNELLGYTIAFDLIEFSFDNAKNSTYFLGYSRYEDMGDKRRWIKRRKQNYFGSTMHFYRSLTANRLKEQHFSIYTIQKQNTDTAAHTANKNKEARIVDKFSIAVPATAANILFTDSLPGQYYLHSPHQLMVKYDKVPDSKFYLERKVLVRGLTRFGFTSYITLLADKVYLDSYGVIHSPLGVVYDGFWVYEKLANQLPFNYSPD